MVYYILKLNIGPWKILLILQAEGSLAYNKRRTDNIV